MSALRQNSRDLGLDLVAAGPVQGIELRIELRFPRRVRSAANIQILVVSKPGDKCKKQDVDCGTAAATAIPA
jgi:hypothetical protein